METVQLVQHQEQEIGWDQFEQEDRWNLIAYLKSNQKIEFGELNVYCMDIEEGESQLEYQWYIIRWLIDKYSEEATAFYQVSAGKQRPYEKWLHEWEINPSQDRRFGPITLRELLKLPTEIQNLTLPSVWYPPKAVIFSYSCKIYIEDSVVDLAQLELNLPVDSNLAPV
jgi:hypothetical protein